MSDDKNTTTKDMVHWIVNAAFAIVFTCGGFIMNMAFNNIDKVEDKVDSIPLTYVTRVDYKDDQGKLFDALKSLGEKMDHNAEYIESDYNRRMDKLEAILTKTVNKE
jgi:hypothetical protein